MSQKMYRSALGKSVDMGALLLKNENVRAVGNMSVNAKGDKLNKINNITVTNNTRTNEIYHKQIQNQIVDTLPESNNKVQAPSHTESELIEGLDTEAEPVADNTFVEEPVVDEVKSPSKKTGGLASAIAKARKVEQEKLKTPREESRGKKGVKKI